MKKPSNFHFILNDTTRWQDILSGAKPKPAEIKNRIITGEDIWVLLTYLHLYHAGYDVTVGSEGREDKINVIDGVKSRPRNTFSNFFYIACRTDAHYPFFGHFVLHQNLIRSEHKNEIYIPQWPQPGLIKRDPKRGNDIQTVAFFGQPVRNLSEEFQSADFKSKLKAKGIEFIIKGKNNNNVEWHDYSNVDLVIAVRDVPVELLKIKPVNKVTNAWLADSLCITGDEPAVEAAFANKDAVLHATTTDGVISIIDLLKNNPDIFSLLREEGRNLAQDYSEDSILKKWIDIETNINTTFQAWKKSSKLKKDINYIHRRILNRISKTKHKWTISRRI